ncbi:MAG TPA: hypothetical protein VI338_07240 [Nitrososphaera sp.]|nr:hypothetical protein [Nitrososphaera sp.]
MATKYVWIGIAVGVFAAGIAIGYSIFAATSQPPFMQMNQNQMFSQMMNDQMGRQQMMTSMMQNEQFMTDMMDDPQFQDRMMQSMRQNHNITQNMMMSMMNDPQIRGQMIGHMFENQEFMEEMQSAMRGNQTNSGGEQENNDAAEEAVATARQFILSKLPSLGIDIDNELDLHTDMVVHVSESEFHIDYSVLDTNGQSHDGHIEIVNGEVTVANLDGKSIL